MCPQKLEVYKCNHCGNIVEILNGFKPMIVCCGENMVLMQENTVDASREKHVPVVEMQPDGIKVKVGSAPHPMIPEHYIEWIQLLTDDRECRANLKPGQEPEAFFPVKPEKFTVRAYCNLHGLWKGE